MDQLADGSCRFRYIANPTSTAKEISDLAARLASLVAPHELKLDPVDYIPCERSGKFQSCASEYREETLTP
jgi:phenylacetate-CoA ligase